MIDNIFVGTVIVSAPAYGIALVSRSDGAIKMKDLVIAHVPKKDSTTGVVIHDHIVEGCTVICAFLPESKEKAYIISSINDALSSTHEAVESRNYYNVDAYTSFDAKTTDELLNQLLQDAAIQVKNRVHGSAIDAIPGDLDIADRSGINGIHIGRLLAQLCGSPFAYIDVSSLSHKVRTVAETVERHTGTSLQIINSDIAVDNIATSTSEAFGLMDDPPFIDTDNEITLADDASIPLYRIQQIKGALADGKETVVSAFPIKETTHTADTPPELLSRQRAALSGELSEASALGLSSIKTPYIRAIQQVGYGMEPLDKDTEVTDTLIPFKYTKEKEDEPKEPPNKELEISDAAINKILDTLLTGDYLDILKERMAARGLIISSKDNVLASKFEDAPLFGPTTEQEYPLPPSLKLTDPITGKEHTYFASTSFITQEPDGSILIADGYGSEIRMSRGNIYIAPALDLFFRPGRDLSAMVPRHQSYNSQDTCTINSSNGMYIRAVNDLKIAGATGGAGVVTVESKDTNISGTGGIVLRSLSNASLTANNVYIGRNTSTELNENTVSDPGPGVIIVDAGTKGSVSVKSKATLIQGTECIIGSLDGSSNSAVMVNQSQISLMASVVVAPAHLAIRNLGDTQQISIPALTGTETVSLTTANDPAISVTGSAAIGGSLKCNESGVFNKGLAASSVASKEGGMLGSIENAAAVFKPAELDAIEVIKQCGVYNADLVYATRSSVYQDYYITYNSFYFPSEYAILPTIRIPGMLWQTNIVEANGSGVWKEDYIKTPDGEDTACYPGIAVWNGANVSARGYSVQGKLNTGYIINAEGR